MFFILLYYHTIIVLTYMRIRCWWYCHYDIRFSQRQPSRSFHHHNRQLSTWCQQPQPLNHHSTAYRHRPSSRRWQHTDRPLVEDHLALWSWCRTISVLSTYHQLVDVVRHLLHSLDLQSSWMQVHDLFSDRRRHRLLLSSSWSVGGTYDPSSTVPVLRRSCCIVDPQSRPVTDVFHRLLSVNPFIYFIIKSYMTGIISMTEHLPLPTGLTVSSAEADHQLRPNGQPRHNIWT